MALSEILDVSDPIVQLRCTGSNEHSNVHRSLLKQVPKVKIQKNKHGILYSMIDSDDWTIHEFATWLYTGAITEDSDVYSSGYEAFEFFMGQNQLAKQLDCTAFMDLTLDLMMERAIRSEGFLCSLEIVNPLLETYPAGSGGWRLALDYVIYIKLGCNDCPMTDEIRRIQNSHFITQLAHKILEKQGLDPEEHCDDTTSQDYYKGLITGYFVGNGNNGDEAARAFPWNHDRCQYHRHTELGLPCYASKTS